ncbi:PREDICTED: uncharacterized protein LOC108762962 [Trachymyrmex cornetzi]|uniref:uncharacterized protein LOC108762962 n=1 Tax=Trachymyrmex cornetzi TaxID=471704 RepID=UPI00084F0B9C|nr:PREDICTED: uncharacterized protein LOC108762962 [Trachymyrmex cornetzi]
MITLTPNNKSNPNAGGDYLATSYSCPIIIRHKSILGLVAQEDIPLVEARRIVATNNPTPLPSYNIIQDFRNFPYLKTKSSSSSFFPSTASPSDINNSNFSSLPTSNRFQHLNDLGDPSSHFPHGSYASVTTTSLQTTSGQGQGHPGPSKGKPTIREIESVAGRYKIASTPYSTGVRTSRPINRSGYSEEHKKLLSTPNGHSKIYPDEVHTGGGPKGSHSSALTNEDSSTTKENESIDHLRDQTRLLLPENQRHPRTVIAPSDKKGHFKPQSCCEDLPAMSFLGKLSSVQEIQSSLFQDLV